MYKREKEKRLKKRITESVCPAPTTQRMLGFRTKFASKSQFTRRHKSKVALRDECKMHIKGGGDSKQLLFFKSL